MAKHPRNALRSTIGNGDRISSLPYSIRCHILSFLPTKFAAGTSILSRRWRYTFLSVSKLDLDDALFLNSRKGYGRKINNKQANQNFLNFVNRLLMLCKLCVDEFQLRCHIPTGDFLQSSWITTVLSRNVKVLDITIGQAEQYDYTLPSEILTCETLEVLKLYVSGYLKVPNSVQLPNLKILHLGNDLEVVIKSSSCWTFSSACFPLLEEIKLSCFSFCGTDTIKICLPSLKKLEWNMLHEHHHLEDGYVPVNGHHLVIDTPNLQHLDYNCELEKFLLECELDALITANILCLQFKDSLDWTRLLSSFLPILGNVEGLGFLEFCRQEFVPSNCSLPEFTNLTHLELQLSFDHHWQLLETLLQNAPNLELLICDLCASEKTDIGLEYGGQEVEPLPFSQHLREIKIEHFSGLDYEFNLVRYLLQHAAALQKMYITRRKPKNFVGGNRQLVKLEKSDEWPSWVLQELLKLPRYSRTCELICLNKVE